MTDIKSQDEAAPAARREPLLTYADVQRILGVSRGTVDYLVEHKGLPVRRLTSRTHRFMPDEVEVWLRNRCSDPAAGQPDDENAA